MSVRVIFDRLMQTASTQDRILAARAAQAADIVARQKAREMQLHQRNAREQRLYAITAITAGVLLAAVLAGGLYLGVTWTMSPRTESRAAAESFAQTRTGQLKIPLDNGWCKTLNFNNTTGEFSNSKLVNCDQFDSSSVVPTPSRRSGYGAFSNSFKIAER